VRTWAQPSSRPETSSAAEGFWVGLDNVAEDEPASIEVLAGYADGGRAWVAEDADGAPVGCLLVDAIDGAAHIEQVSVAPGHQGRGLGRALVERVAQWAASQGMTAVTLTTFAQVPWNRPLYELADALRGAGRFGSVPMGAETHAG
jgi:GNAT superfamily N-acetyltransferase